MKRGLEFLLKEVASVLIGVGSLVNTGKAYDLSSKCFVNSETNAAVAVGVAESNDLSPFQRYLTFPRSPVISDNWIGYVQKKNIQLTDDPNNISGDLYLIHLPTNKTIKLTESERAADPDIFAESLVYNDGGKLYLADLSSIDINNLIPIESDIYKPNSFKKIWITEGREEGGGCAQINQNRIVFRTGGYNQDDKTAKNSWKEILAYLDFSLDNITRRGRILPVSNVEGNKWLPSISGNWAAYAVYRGRVLGKDEKVEQMGNWNVYAYNFPTGLETRVENDLYWYCRSVAIYDDLDSGQAILAYEKHNYENNESGIRIRRLKIEKVNGEYKIIIDPNENPYRIEKELIIGGGVDWLDMHGARGQGPVLVWADYSNVGASGTDIKGINLRTGVKFDVCVQAGWQYCPKVWFDNAGEVLVTWRDDNYLLPQTQIKIFSNLNAETNSIKVPAMVLNEIIDKPKPNFCGDLGTDYLNADINRDCHVDFYDFLLLGENWLRNDCCYENDLCTLADTNKDSQVDSEDFKAVVWDLGKSTDPLDPNCLQCRLQIPKTEPNLTATTSTGKYREDFDYYESELQIHPIQTEKNVITYIFNDKSFGLLDASRIEIPTTGIEEIFAEQDYRDAYFPDLENSIAKNWTFSQTENQVVLESANPSYNLNAGKKLAFALVYATPRCEERDVTLQTSVGSLVYKLPVPLEKTLAGDINSDGTVDEHDLKILYDYWLFSSRLNKESGDIFRDGGVDFKDFAILANEFRKKEKWKE